MQIYTHTLPGGAQLIGYLRDRTVEMPAFNTRPAILILPGGGYAWCSKREADPLPCSSCRLATTSLPSITPAEVTRPCPRCVGSR